MIGFGGFYSLYETCSEASKVGPAYFVAWECLRRAVDLDAS